MQQIQRLTSAKRTGRTKWTRTTDWQRMERNANAERRYQERFSKILAQLVEEYQRTGRVPQ